LIYKDSWNPRSQRRDLGHPALRSDIIWAISKLLEGGLPMKKIAVLCAFLFGLTLPATAREDWQSDLHKWKELSQADPNCKVRYTTGLYRPDLGDRPVWGVMTEKLFKWFSKDGVKLAPSICPVSRATQDKAQYRILFSESPMKTVSQTTHGSEVRTVNEPFSADVTSHTTYSDGGSASSTATVNGQQTSTVVVPTETTISQSSVAEYMYTYRVNGNQLELIATDSVVFSRVAASGSGDDAATAELSAGIGNLIRGSGDRHRADKLCEEALRAIRADAQDNAAKKDALPENHTPERAPVDMPAVAATAVLAAAPVRDQAPVSIESAESAQSIAMLQERAASGDADAQSSLADAFVYGKSVPQDYSKAAAWYRKAADQGDAGAQYNLGVLYDGGLGLPQDHARAAVWYRKAANLGHADSESNLGSLYDSGEGVTKDHVLAASWYHKAAEHGSAAGQNNLGVSYLYGIGVPQDYAEAYFWLNLAAAGMQGKDQAKAIENRNNVAAKLTPAELSREQERARKWFEDHPANP
jgi:TPR repeat protein